MLTRYASLRRFAFLLCGDWDEAEDLVQVALARCSRRWHDVEEPHAYVRTAVVRASSSWRRRRLREGVAVPLSDWAAPAGNSDARLVLLAALRALPLVQRQVLVLRYYEGLSEREIAAVLDVAPGTVKSRCARGLATLRTSDLAMTFDGEL